jgi:hypothetical protein
LNLGGNKLTGAIPLLPPGTQLFNVRWVALRRKHQKGKVGKQWGRCGWGRVGGEGRGRKRAGENSWHLILKSLGCSAVGTTM